MTVLWQATSLKDFSGLEQKRPEQATQGTDGTLRAEVRFGDQVPGLSDARTLWNVGQLIGNEGDEWWIGLTPIFPPDWIGWFPKNDELSNWPGNSDRLKGGIHGGSFFELHHAPPDGDWSKIKGSAPFYAVATDTEIKAYLVDPAVGPRPDATWTLAPLVRGKPVALVFHFVLSVDPAKGLVEIWADGKQVVGPFRAATLYPGTVVYPQVGLYRRGFIGDPSLTWWGQPRPGVNYPTAYTPRMGARVFQDVTPQSVQFKTPIIIGTTKGDVMAQTPTQNAPAAPAWIYDRLRKLLEDQVAQAEADIESATNRRDSVQAELNTLVAKLNSGDKWLAP